MTIPSNALAILRDVISMSERAETCYEELLTMSEQASGAEAVGIDALAAEVEQVAKVLKNYMPRLLKHVGELEPAMNAVPDGLGDLVRENEAYGDTRDRLWQAFLDCQTKIADNGKSLPLPTSEEILLYGRLFPHMGWLSKPSAVEII